MGLELARGGENNIKRAQRGAHPFTRRMHCSRACRGKTTAQTETETSGAAGERGPGGREEEITVRTEGGCSIKMKGWMDRGGARALCAMGQWGN